MVCRWVAENPGLTLVYAPSLSPSRNRFARNYVTSIYDFARSTLTHAVRYIRVSVLPPQIDFAWVYRVLWWRISHWFNPRTSGFNGFAAIAILLLGQYSAGSRVRITTVSREHLPSGVSKETLLSAIMGAFFCFVLEKALTSWKLGIFLFFHSRAAIEVLLLHPPITLPVYLVSIVATFNQVDIHAALRS